jgi:anti-sigma B factor antagonist
MTRAVPCGVAFEVDVTRRGDADVATVRGELDIATAPQLASALEGTTGRIVVDLTETSFLDSTGLRTLTTLGKADDSKLALVCPESNRAVLLVLELSRLDTVIDRFETLEAAGVAEA